MSRTTLRNAPIHILAAALALGYAGLISQTAFVATGLQFIGPVLVILGVHLGWLAVSGQLTRGFSNTIYWRSAQTAVTMAVAIFVGSILAPTPAQADVGEVVETILMVMFCVAIIAVIGGIVALFIYVLAKLISAPFKSKDDDDGPQTRLRDGASLSIAVTVLIAGSVEGISPLTSFATENHSSATYQIDATPVQVWTVMETATSPDVPLRALLMSFPQPTEVVIDEGTALGAMRRVAFQGREGAGHLTLQVTDRTDTKATFTVVSDTTPYAAWVAYQTLTYDVVAMGQGTQITVTLTYDRMLSPSWFFTPAMTGAAHLAMDVLARDVKTQAEAL